VDVGSDAGSAVSSGEVLRAERGQRLPLLFAGGAGLVIPYLLAVRAPWYALVLALTIAAWGLRVAWLRRPGGRGEHRTVWHGRIESAVAVAGYGMLLVVDGGNDPGASVFLAAGLVATVAVLDELAVRATLQVVTAAAAGLAIGFAGAWSEAVLVVVLLAAVAMLSSAYASERVDSGRRQRAARRDAERRNELLAALEGLPSDTADGAVRAVVRALRELGYDGAGVELLQGEVLELVHIEGLPPLPPPPPGQGFAWECIRSRTTVVTDDYGGSAARRPDRDGVGGAVATPIAIGAEPIGALLGLRATATAPTPAEIEVVEVLAAHLGGVLGRLRSDRRQREQHDRLERLEHLRAGMVGALSAELRGPLADVRAVTTTLVGSPGLAASAQQPLLEVLGRRTDDLRRTVDTLLDVSRFQARRQTPDRRPVDVRALLTAAVADDLAEVATDPGAFASLGAVEVDAELVRHALELLLRSGSGSAVDERPGWRVSVRTVPDHVVLVLHHAGGPPSGVVRSLASQLLLAAGASLTEAGPLGIMLPTAGGHDAGPRRALERGP
jgi:GAF domain-containing protein